MQVLVFKIIKYALHVVHYSSTVNTVVNLASSSEREFNMEWINRLMYIIKTRRMIIILSSKFQVS